MLVSRLPIVQVTHEEEEKKQEITATSKTKTNLKVQKNMVVIKEKLQNYLIK